jgi:hypothetical protein
VWLSTRLPYHKGPESEEEAEVLDEGEE